MKRDIELIRKIMLWIDDQPHGSILEAPKVEGHSEEEIGYHVYLLSDAGLLEGLDVTTMDDKSPNWIPKHLTSAGHDFVQAVRDDTLWKKAKDVVLKPAGAWTLQTLVAWLKLEVRTRLGLPPA